MKMMEIYSALRIFDEDASEHVAYAAELASEMNASLHLVAAQSIVQPETNPAVIVGEGVPSLALHSVEESYKESEAKLHELSEVAQEIGADVKAHLDFGMLTERAEQLDKDETDLWTVYRRSGDSFINDIMGTLETELAKKLNTPVLNISDDTEYKKPEKVVVVVGYSGQELDVMSIDKLARKLDFNTDFLVELPSELPDDMTPLGYFRQKINMPFSRLRGHIQFAETKDMMSSMERIISDKSPDWLALTGTDKPFYNRLFSAYNTNHIVLSSHRPVLVYG